MNNNYSENSNIDCNGDFDFSPYSEGWNGIGLKENLAVHKNLNSEKIYSHNPDAAAELEKYDHDSGKYGFSDMGAKDLMEGEVVYLKDISLIGGDELLASTTVGTDIIINLGKESGFFASFGMKKADFKNDIFGTKNGKKNFLDKKFPAMINKCGYGSLSDGLLYKTKQEFMEQINLGDKADKAYTAHIESLNRGGYIVTLQGITAFLPGSLASMNKITNFSELLDTDIIVMIEGYDARNGFIVSGKKYYTHIMPKLISDFKESFDKDPDKQYTGTITGTKYFGVFIEFGKYFNGLLYKKYASEELLSKLTAGELNTGDSITFYIHDIIKDKNGNDRIVLSDIEPKEREKIIKIRDAQHEQKEREYIEKRNEMRVQLNKKNVKTIQKDENLRFSGKSISSFDELKYSGKTE